MMWEQGGGVKLIRGRNDEKHRQNCLLFVWMNGVKFHVDKIDWANWRPSEHANLCFIMRDGQILLIRKKRGLGAGKINGPGGRLEPGETPMQAAIRETQEEIGVTPLELEEVGDLFFQFVDGYKLHVTVFVAGGCTGCLIETDEAKPMWTEISKIPYDEMWQDDPYWLPLTLSRTRFKGYFVFEGERLLNHRVDIIQSYPTQQ